MNNNSIDIKIIAKDLASATLKEVRGQVVGLDKDTQDASRGSNILTGAVAGLTAAVTSFGISLITSGIENVANWFGNAVDMAAQYETTLIGLRLQTKRYGIDEMAARKAAEMLGKELKIGVGPAAEGLLSLFKGGLGLDQSIELMRRFGNEAYTVSGNSLTLAQKVQNLAYAFQTNNSAIGNASGISENWGLIAEKGTQILIEQGVATEDITEAMAKYAGTIDITAASLGLAESLSETYSGKQATLNLKMQEFQTKIGNLLLPIVIELYDVFTELFDAISPKLQEWAHNVIPEIGRIFREDIVPRIKEFIQYLGSKQFKSDIEGLKNTFVTIKDTIFSIVGKFGELTRTVGDFATQNAGVADYLKQGASDPLGTAIFGPILPFLRQTGILPKYAEGTNYHPGGMALVGEKGPEIVNLPRGSQVIPNGGGGGMVFNFYGYDRDQISTTINNQIKYGY